LIIYFKFTFMQITHINIYRFSIPMEPFTIATGTMNSAQNTFVRVYTDAGFYGVGECSAFPMITGETQETCLAMARDFAVLWKGTNPLEIEQRLQQLHDAAAFNGTIKSAFDMALYDIAAKHAGQPLYQFLGGRRKDVETDITVGIYAPELMAEKALKFAQKGANLIKVKLGKDAVMDVERIRQIRLAVGPDIKLRVDANQGWSFEEAVLALQGISQFDVQFCEQPMRTWNNHRLPELRSLSPVHIMADESVYTHHDARQQLTTGSCDYINIKFAKSGGINEAMKIQDLAASYQVPCMMGGMLESRIALSAQLHFAMAMPNIKFYDMDTCMLGHLADPCIGGVQYQGYHLTIDDAPGIGADASEDFLAQCEHWTI
jgi:L-alanine-DL-glutamate epimerase-like enolase superfamily enzyme